MKIYVPNLQNYQCFVVQSEDIIRAYEQIPVHNSTINYRDYYIHSDYIYKDSSQLFSNYGVLPICLNESVLTDSVYYRVDFDSILVIFVLLALIICYIQLKITSKFFRRFRI